MSPRSKRSVFNTEACAAGVRFFKTLRLDEARDVRCAAGSLGTLHRKVRLNSRFDAEWLLDSLRDPKRAF
ncbi:MULTISPECIES: hypothetical protein [Paenibacillus]|uniref:hypothetical protein n=1 Tax=Paenibacillus TaxID=44249 RepID=UPI00135F15E5|nr:hypothetical protein [Paenibacillus vortex]